MHCCARCGRQVFVTEAKIAFSKVWHSFCFSCYKCRKLLDEWNLRCFEGEIFCNACYKCCCLPVPEKPDCRSCRPSKSRTTTCIPCKDTCTITCNPWSKTCVVSADSCTVCTDSCDSCEYTDFCCEPCDHCQIVCKPCERRLSYCCLRKPISINCKRTSRSTICCFCPKTYCLHPVCIREKYNCSCANKIRSLTCMSRRKTCSPCSGSRKCSPPPCCPVKSKSPCPVPRETSNYYNRNHTKDEENNCMCKRCGKPCCNPCVILDCTPPKNCMPSKCCGIPIKSCNSPCAPPCKPCPPTPRCCPPAKHCPPLKICPPRPCCPPKCIDMCNKFSPARKPVCYPPLKCCEPPVPERICFFSGPPCVKCCAYCASHPCSCDLNYKRIQALCENSPKCVRCGRKVYAAEKIVVSCGSYHNTCFSCFCCRKPLEVTNVYESNGEIYCKCCHSKWFGPKGYGYGACLLTST